MNQNLVFLDTETTGLLPYTHEVIEVAVVGMDEDDRDDWVSRVLPSRPDQASSTALELNGLDPKSWVNEPTPLEVALRVQESLRGRTVVGHNVTFDLDFLCALCVESGASKRGTYEEVLGIAGHIDTQTLVREHLFPHGLDSASLDSTREFLGWSKEGAHTALKDAQDVRRLFFVLERADLLDAVLFRRKGRIYLRKKGENHVQSV